MMDCQLMGEFEADIKELEADSWSFTVDKKFLKPLKKDVIKRQDVIYGKNNSRPYTFKSSKYSPFNLIFPLSISELIQTEMHHVRTLKIMADVYSKGLLREVQLEVQTVEKMFPMLEEVLDLHTQFFSQKSMCGILPFLKSKMFSKYILISQFYLLHIYLPVDI